MNQEAMAHNDFMNKWDKCCVDVQLTKGFFKWTISKWKSMDTDDGLAFACTLVFFGKEVGVAKNGGTGGPDHIRFDKPLEGEAKQSWEEMLVIAKQVSEYEPEALVLDCILKRHGK